MLKLVYGKSGSGKSTFLYEDIQRNMDREKVFLIVPEQSNLKAEQKLFAHLGTKSIFNVQVLTLSRLAVRVLEEVGGEDFVTIDNSSKAMVIYDILNREKGNLHFLGKSDKNIEIVANMITELKKHNITQEILENSKTIDTLTNLKLEDIKLIFQKYQEKLQGNFVDENDILSIVTPKILEASIFEDATVYIDDFMGFTPQEYGVFENILKVAENVTIAVSTDNLNVGDKESDIFYFNKLFANRLVEIADKNGVKVETVRIEGKSKNRTRRVKVFGNSV
ncbi:MAG: hypothetical protein IJ867_05110 [Clostridia bacterium]|nr:hypothetical protein [Clostridia bacterium]